MSTLGYERKAVTAPYDEFPDAGEIQASDIFPLERSGAYMQTSLGRIATINKGGKIDLDLVYVSPDTLSLRAGAAHVNDGTVDYWTVKDATTITSGTTGYPSAGSWVYVTLKGDGTVTLRAATGTAAQRPTDNLFQRTGGSVGYDDIGKYGYYYDADERVVAAFHKVSSTSFYIINLGDRLIEKGENSNGEYTRNNSRIMEQFSIQTSTVSNYGTWTFPVPYPSATNLNCTGNHREGGGSSLIISFDPPATTYVVWGCIVTTTAAYYNAAKKNSLRVIGNF